MGSLNVAVNVGVGARPGDRSSIADKVKNRDLASSPLPPPLATAPSATSHPQSRHGRPVSPSLPPRPSGNAIRTPPSIPARSPRSVSPATMGPAVGIRVTSTPVARGRPANAPRTISPAGAARARGPPAPARPGVGLGSAIYGTTGGKRSKSPNPPRNSQMDYSSIGRRHGDATRITYQMDANAGTIAKVESVMVPHTVKLEVATPHPIFSSPAVVHALKTTIMISEHSTIKSIQDGMAESLENTVGYNLSVILRPEFQNVTFTFQANVSMQPIAIPLDVSLYRFIEEKVGGKSTGLAILNAHWPLIGQKCLSLRHKVVQEIYTTETTYIASLLEMGMLRNSLHELARSRLSGKSLNNLVANLENIFGNLEAITSANMEILHSVEEALSTWTDNKAMGQIFVHLCPVLVIYVQWGTNYTQAISVTEKSRNIPKLPKEIDEKLGNLSSMLIQPIQRLPRYVLLLENLLEATPPNHPDYENSKKAVATMQALCERVNTKVKSSQNVSDLINKISPPFQSLMEAHRQLQCFYKVKSRYMGFGDCPYGSNDTSGKGTIVLYLFNDLLAFCPEKDASSKSTKPTIIPIRLVWFHEDEFGGGRAKPGLQSGFIVPFTRIQMTFKNKHECNLWQDYVANVLRENGIENNPVCRKGTFTFANGAIYSGGWRLGLPSGDGTLTARSVEYNGGFENGRQHGKGVCRYFSGDVYEGEYVAGERDGHGKLTYRSGNSFEGTFEKDRISRGTMTLLDGTTFSGVFQNGMLTGRGEMESNKTGIKYKGEFRSNAIHGRGRLQYSNRRYYDGDFVRGRRHGQGQYEDGLGGLYSGHWADDVYHGQGKLISANGVVYDGEFVHGLKECKHATQIYEDGSQYVGPFKAGLREGDGKLVYVNKDSYIGGWSNDVRHGKGVEKVRTLQLEGTWRNGFRHGEFTVTRLTPVCGAPEGVSTTAPSFLNFHGIDVSGQETQKKTSVTFKDGVLVSPASHAWFSEADARCENPFPTLDTLLG